MILSADPGSVIVCNGETKPPMETWDGLSINTFYTVYAYRPEDPIANRSTDGPSTTFRTLNLPPLPTPTSGYGNTLKEIYDRIYAML